MKHYKTGNFDSLTLFRHRDSTSEHRKKNK